MASKTSSTLRTGLALTLAALVPACSPSDATDVDATTGSSVQVATQDAGGVRGLLLAEPFQLARPYTHDWRAEAPEVDAGWLLVLAVDPEVARRSQVAEPVLIVGGETAERINDGDVSGRLIVIVPSRFDAERGLPRLDPRTAMAWFGEPALPERTGAAELARELEAARTAGLPTLGASRRTRVDAVRSELVQLPGRTALERRAAELVLEWSPPEAELAESLLAPLVE